MASFCSCYSIPSLSLHQINKTSFSISSNFKSFSSSSLSLQSKFSISATTTTVTASMSNPPVMKKRKRYRKEYPGESVGITEEMRFVAMRLRNIKGKYVNKTGNEPIDESASSSTDADDDDDADDDNDTVSSSGGGGGDGGGRWEPSVLGFVKYLVDSKLVFDTIERIVDQSEDVSYAYFRKTGIERSAGLTEDLEWFRLQNIEIPEPSNAGVSYVNYLEGLAEKSAPLFLAHFYNIYFSHIAGGQVIAKQVSNKVLEGKELEFYRWEGDVEPRLKCLRDNLNMLGEHWTRDARNKCLKETTKCFRYMGQIVRLIIL